MTNWRKSSYSGSSGDDNYTCVEAAAFTASVGVRDSKHPERGHLDLSVRVWRGLIAGLR